MTNSVELLRDTCLHCSAARMPQDDEQRRPQMRAGVLQRPGDGGTKDISGHAYDEQLTESSIEQKLRWYAAVAASKNGDIGLLALCQIGQDFLLHSWEPCATANEARIAFFKRSSAPCAVYAGRTLWAKIRDLLGVKAL